MCMILKILDFAKNRAHHFNQMYHALVVDIVKNPVGILLEIQNAFVSEYRQMLRDIALTGAYLVNYILDADRFIAKHA